MTIEEKEDSHFNDSLGMEIMNPGVFSLEEMLGFPREGKDSYDLYFYGGGRFGQTAYKQFIEQGFHVKGIIDRKPENVTIPAPVLSLKEAEGIDKERSLIVLTLVLEKPQDVEAVIQQLKTLGFSNICYCGDYTVQNAMFYQDLYELNIFEKNKEKIKKVLTILEDEESRAVLCGFIRGCITKKFLEHVRLTNSNEYNPDVTPATTNWNSMIDVGAFTGDSLQRAMVYREHLENYIALEPDWKNFEKLCSTMKTFRHNITRINILPCALGRENHTVYFDASEDTNSRVTDIGKAAVPMIRLDDVMQNNCLQDHVLIKMDIEGMELEALKGASNFIVKKKPDLMICIYHHIADLWEIPLYLHGLMPDYIFSMRCYTVFGNETILYATCR